MVEHFEKFLYSYVLFLFFIVFIIGLGAGAYFGGNIAGLVAPTPPDPPETTGNGILDWLTGVANSGTYFAQNIAFFFTLMSINTGIAWMGTLIFSPAIVFLVWGVVKHLIRG
jgi:hypothetical protein